jgi:hypothetical protein
MSGQVAPVAAHGEQHVVEAGGRRHVVEAAVAAVPVQPRLAPLGRQAAQVLPHPLRRAEVVARREQVQPAVVVEVEEEGREGLHGLADAGARRHVLQARPLAGAQVAEEPVGRVDGRDVEVGPAVVVGVAERDALHVGAHVHARRRRALVERAVAAVHEELAGVGLVHRLVADVEVEIAVHVHVREGARLGRVEGQQARRLGHVVEARPAVVAQQRVGHAPVLLEPCAAQHDHVHVAVLVDVGVQQVEAAGDTRQPQLRAAVAEAPVALVAQEGERVAQAPRRG